MNMLKGHGSVAQLEEHETFNLGVAGSIPATLTSAGRVLWVVGAQQNRDTKS